MARAGSLSSTALPESVPSRPEKERSAQPNPACASTSLPRAVRSRSMRACSIWTAAQPMRATGTRPHSQRHGLHRMIGELPNCSGSRRRARRPIPPHPPASQQSALFGVAGPKRCGVAVPRFPRCRVSPENDRSVLRGTIDKAAGHSKASAPHHGQRRSGGFPLLPHCRLQPATASVLPALPVFIFCHGQRGTARPIVAPAGKSPRAGAGMPVAARRGMETKVNARRAA